MNGNEPAVSADPNLARAVATLTQLQGLGSAAYGQNGPVLLSEAATSAAVAEAVTNRIRLLTDLLGSRETIAYGHTLPAERHRLLGLILGEEA